MESFVEVRSDDPDVAEQFEDAEQQREASTLGMWAFLSTEVLFFGALFTGYFVYRTRYPQAFRAGSEDMKLWLGGINTAVLLTSSLLMAMVVHSAALGDRQRIERYLIGTMVLGVAFLGIKGTEYGLETREHLVPGYNFSTIPPDEVDKPIAEQHPRPDRERLFMCFYFIMTGLHALHMVIGISVMGTLLALTRRGWFSEDYHNPIEMAGLYWHFVDMVWVFLYPCLYLLRQG